MAKTKNPQTLGQNIRARRVAASLSLNDMAILVCIELPRARWIVAETVRRYETGDVLEAKADPVLVSAMARVLDCKVADLSEEVADAMLTIRDMLDALPDKRPTPGRRRSDSRCSSSLLVSS